LLLSESSSFVYQAGWGTVVGHTIKTSSYSWLPVSVLELFLHATVTGHNYSLIAWFYIKCENVLAGVISVSILA